MAKSKVIIYDQVIDSLLNRASNTVLKAVTADIKINAYSITPKDTGELRDSVKTQILGSKAKMVWDKEYAAAQEEGFVRGYPVVNYTTAGTGKEYAKTALKKTMDNFDRVIAQAGEVI